MVKMAKQSLLSVIYYLSAKMFCLLKIKKKANGFIDRESNIAYKNHRPGANKNNQDFIGGDNGYL